MTPDYLIDATDPDDVIVWRKDGLPNSVNKFWPAAEQIDKQYDDPDVLAKIVDGVVRDW